MFWRKKKPEGPRGELPPHQAPIKELMRWGIDHPGITPILPVIDKKDWSLVVDGEVDVSFKLNWDDFMALPQVEVVSNFHCVEGWSVLSQKWGGVLFSVLQERVKPKEVAKYALFECADGYTTSLPLSDLQGGDVVLAHRLNGADLSQPLGGPMRLVVPKKYAYKSAMWLTKITFVSHDKLGFWERGYYSNTADIWTNDRYRNDN
ncbi:MAG: molybdopterin-dependent oxidoreductase [Candidatus Bathyarchaeia archaeon]